MDQRIAELVQLELTEKEENRVAAHFVVSEQLPSFQGHFPGDPILPAVSIIDISLHLLSQITDDVSHSNIQVKRSKFMSMVRPNQKIELLGESEDGKNWKVSWKLSENQSKLAQVHLVI